MKDLRKAISKTSEAFSDEGGNISGDAINLVLAAARRELERQEAPETKVIYSDKDGWLLQAPADATQETWMPAQKTLIDSIKKKPKRASLEEIEKALRIASWVNEHGDISQQAADILRALRETVVPWLRSVAITSDGRDGLTMLRVLGEEP